MNENNFNIQEIVEPKDFNNFASEYGNHIHLIPVPDARRLLAFLHTGEAGSGEVVKTTIDNVSFKYHLENEENDIQSWFLNGNEAENFLTFVNSLKWERTDTSTTVTYYEESGMKMMEDTPFGEESLMMEYKTDSGNRQMVAMDSIFRKSFGDVHKMVNFK